MTGRLRSFSFAFRQLLRLQILPSEPSQRLRAIFSLQCLDVLFLALVENPGWFVFDLVAHHDVVLFPALFSFQHTNRFIDRGTCLFLKALLRLFKLVTTRSREHRLPRATIVEGHRVEPLSPWQIRAFRVLLGLNEYVELFAFPRDFDIGGKLGCSLVWGSET